MLNDSKVIPARLWGVNPSTGTTFEILLLEEMAPNEWQAMMRPGRKARLHTRIQLTNHQGTLAPIHAVVTGRNDEGHRRLRFEGTPNLWDSLSRLGEVPLPPYIRRAPGSDLEADNLRYQTVYATTQGSVAAPTAGLHFTETLLEQIRRKGVEVCQVTLHVGLGTFAPVKTAQITAHPMHEERYSLSDSTAATITKAKSEGRRIVAVGTTSVRVLESVVAKNAGQLSGGSSTTRLFIYPPHQFQIVDALLTNFHLPRSTLLMLVSAFAAPEELRGRDLILAAYTEAVRRRYRFFSYGDAMLIE